MTTGGECTVLCFVRDTQRLCQGEPTGEGLTCIDAALRRGTQPRVRAIHTPHQTPCQTYVRQRRTQSLSVVRHTPIARTRTSVTRGYSPVRTAKVAHTRAEGEVLSHVAMPHARLFRKQEFRLLRQVVQLLQHPGVQRRRRQPRVRVIRCRSNPRSQISRDVNTADST
jgi:hypothetical protein